jgi:tetratricopeptide (TPR) repeat protein
MKSAIQKQTQEEEITRLKEQGRLYLKANQVGKALRIFSTVLKEHPEDIDSMLILGDSYLLAGDQAYALMLYQEAYQLAPERRDIKRRITILQSRSELLSIPELLPTHPRAVADLIRKLTGQSSQVPQKELDQAGKLLEDYLRSDSPAQAVADHMEEINSLLPALIELNISQARLDGRFDVADSLQELLSGMLLQVDIQGENLSGSKRDKAEPKKKRRVLLGGVVSKEAPYRLPFIQQVLMDAGFEVIVADDGKPDEITNWESFELAVMHNPHASRLLTRGMAARATANRPVIVDLATDFTRLPDHHPDLPLLGLTDPAVKRAYHASLQLASCICVSNETFAASLRQTSLPVELIPEGWNQFDIMWARPFHNSSFFNLGLNLMAGQLDDAIPLRRAVTRVVREFPHTRLIISGDMDVYQMFDNLPDARKLFLPPVEIEDYPYLLARMDLLMVPLKEDEYNRFRSDRLLMEAGVRRIPWVATPVPAHVEWASGGLMASSSDEWYVQLQTLIQDAELRQKLGQSGYQKALQRESQSIGKIWIQLINRLVRV